MIKTLRVLRNGGYMKTPIALMVGKESQGIHAKQMAEPKVVQVWFK